MILSLVACSLIYLPDPVDPQFIKYSIRPMPGKDRSVLAVTCSFRAPGTEPFTVGLPQDGFGLGDLSASVVSFVGTGGTRVGPGKDRSERSVTPGTAGQIALHYELSFDPERIQGASYGPIATRDQVQTFACQLALRIGDPDSVKRLHFEFEDLPKGWISYSSLSPNPARYDLQGNELSLRQVVIGAGAGRHKRFKVKGKPVDVFIGRGLLKIRLNG